MTGTLPEQLSNLVRLETLYVSAEVSAHDLFVLMSHSDHSTTISSEELYPQAIKTFTAWFYCTLILTLRH
jgi:hypothetical protein